MKNVCWFQDCGTLEMKRSHVGFVTQCLVLTKRSFMNMFRDLGYYWLRLAIYVAIAIGLATVFNDVGYSYGSIQVILKRDILNINSLYIWYIMQIRINSKAKLIIAIYIYFQARSSLIMFVSSFLTLMSIGGFPSFVEDMKVCFVSHLSINQFYAQRSTSFL